jgi:uncharacterized protein involved in outer membrane biogenesis
VPGKALSESNQDTNLQPSVSRSPRGTPKWVKFLLVALISIIAFAEFAPYLLNLDRYRNEIASLLSEQTGRPVHLGKLRAQFLPRLGFVVETAEIGNPAGFPQADLASAHEIRATIAFWPLLRRRIELNSLELVRPKISLLQNAQGQCNYLLASAPDVLPVSEAGFSDSSAGVVLSDFSFSLTGIANVHLTDAELQLGKIDPSGAEVLDLDAKHLNGNLSSVALSPLDFQRWRGNADLQGLQATLPGWPQPIVFLSGSLVLDSGHLKADFSADLGAAGDLRGTVAVNDSANPIVQFDLQSNQLTLDAIPYAAMPAPAAVRAPDPPGDPPPISQLVAQGKLTAQRVLWQTYTAGPLTAELRLFNDRAELWPFTLGVYGGVVQATARLDRASEPERFSANIQARTVDLGRLLDDSPSLKGKLYGVSEFDLQVFGSLETDWRKSLTGTGMFSVRDGHLPTLNLSAAPGAAIESDSPPAPTPFRRIAGDVAIAAQRFASHRIHIDAPSGSVDLQGSLGFNGSIDYQGQISFPGGAASSSSSATEGIAAYLSQILRNAAGKLVVPFTLKGTLAQPQVLPAQAASARR